MSRPQAMHAKTDSEATSLDASTPPRSPRRPLYYVQSPSNHDVEKNSYGSSPLASPTHHYYHCSPINHSRQSSTSRFSAPLKGGGILGPAWEKIPSGHQQADETVEDAEENEGSGGRNVGLYLCFFVLFVLLFALFSLILWGSSKAYKPKISVKNIVFEEFNLQSGVDATGVATDMLSLNSTVRMLYRNPGTFFGVHVTSTPFELFYYDLRIASGEMKKFYQSRKSQRVVTTVVFGNQVPLYGSVPVQVFTKEQLRAIHLPLNLTFVVRSRAYILGRLVKSKFYRTIHCSTIFRGSKLGQPLNMSNSCI